MVNCSSYTHHALYLLPFWPPGLEAHWEWGLYLFQCQEWQQSIQRWTWLALRSNPWSGALGDQCRIESHGGLIPCCRTESHGPLTAHGNMSCLPQHYVALFSLGTQLESCKTSLWVQKAKLKAKTKFGCFQILDLFFQNEENKLTKAKIKK